MLIRTNRCQSQCVRASSMVCSSVQTDKAQAHHSFPKRDCSNISSEKACLWDINYWEKRVLLRSKQDSYCLFFFLLWSWKVHDCPSALVSCDFICCNCSQGEANEDWNWQQFRQVLCKPFTKFCCSTWAPQSKCLSSLNHGICCSLKQMLPIIKLRGGLLIVL